MTAITARGNVLPLHNISNSTPSRFSKFPSAGRLIKIGSFAAISSGVGLASFYAGSKYSGNSTKQFMNYPAVNRRLAEPSVAPADPNLTPLTAEEYQKYGSFTFPENGSDILDLGAGTIDMENFLNNIASGKYLESTSNPDPITGDAGERVNHPANVPLDHLVSKIAHRFANYDETRSAVAITAGDAGQFVAKGAVKGAFDAAVEINSNQSDEVDSLLDEGVSRISPVLEKLVDAAISPLKPTSASGSANVAAGVSVATVVGIPLALLLISLYLRNQSTGGNTIQRLALDALLGSRKGLKGVLSDSGTAVQNFFMKPPKATSEDPNPKNNLEKLNEFVATEKGGAFVQAVTKHIMLGGFTALKATFPQFKPEEMTQQEALKFIESATKKIVTGAAEGVKEFLPDTENPLATPYQKLQAATKTLALSATDGVADSAATNPQIAKVLSQVQTFINLAERVEQPAQAAIRGFANLARNAEIYGGAPAPAPGANRNQNA